jgi:hypothetical protein
MPRTQVTAQERQRIIERARGHCEYCRSPVNFATPSFSAEHIIPVSRGGETILDNLALACPGCNGHKYTKIDEAADPTDGALIPLYNPRIQRWRAHFNWNEDFTCIIGLTPTGRATVNTLRMNRTGVMNMRRVLFVSGLHPPTDDE